MLYMSCPSCGYFLGYKTLEYEQKKEKICSNPNTTIKEKEIENNKLLLSLGLRRYCCKTRIITYKDIVKDILPIVKK
jgi:DNA-directed RNA polymerase subunit N (RpoN/RPB10)